jgi:hypothetical protein
MAMNRRGIFFTAVAISLVAVVLLGYTIYESFSLREQSAIESVRIRTMNSFTADVERDMERSLYIASFRALLGADQYITDNGVYLDDADSQLAELVLYGTINGSYTNMTSDNYFFEWVSRVQQLADNIGVQLNISYINVTVYQTSPWSMTFQLDSDLKLTDDVQQVSWTRDNSMSSTISILEFEDPLYTVSSGKRIINTVRESPFSDFVNGDDTTNLSLHESLMYYIQSDSGPSYMMRLQGDTGPGGSNGIESLIDVTQLAFQGFDTNQSVVDYIYWSGVSVTSYAINNTNFRLDNESDHLARYEVAHLAS